MGGRYEVVDGYVTVETNIGPGRAEIDLPRGTVLPDDVPAEQIERLLRQGQIRSLAPAEPVDDDGQGDADGVGPDDDPDPVPDGTVAAVIEWVAGDPDRAARALDAEQAKGEQARKTLVDALTALIPNE